MDLILLQPGNLGLLGAGNASDKNETLLNNQWSDAGIDAEKCIEIVSIHQGMKQQVTTDVSNSARTSGRPVVTEFTLVKYVDKTSIKLYDYCLRAEPIGKGKDNPTKIYFLRNSGDRIANILTISLRDALISEIQFQSHPDDMPTEQFKLNFTEILWSYAVQKNDGTVIENVASGWSVARNRTITQFTD